MGQAVGHRWADVNAALATGVVVVLGLFAFSAIRVTGGSPNALNHLAYLPIAIAAHAFGWRGGLVTGLGMGLVLGPLPAALAFQGVEGPSQWALRGVFFTAIGTLLGGLFDRSRHAIAGWRQTVEVISERERDGMVALARGAEAKDTDTGEHILRVQLTSRMLASLAGLDDTAAEDVGWAAMLHDVGKLRVPDQILMKPGPLTPDEWTVVRQHPIWGERILARGAGFELARSVARWHHENFDGTGYPDRLYGDRIPLAARIVRITDAFDAMTNRRPYSDARSFEAALEELAFQSGRQFDPALAELMIGTVRNDAALRRALRDLRSV